MRKAEGRNLLKSERLGKHVAEQVWARTCAGSPEPGLVPFPRYHIHLPFSLSPLQWVKLSLALMRDWK